MDEVLDRNIATDVDASFGEDAELIAMEIEAGLRNSEGKLINSEEEVEEEHAMKTQGLEDTVEKGRKIREDAEKQSDTGQDPLTQKLGLGEVATETKKVIDQAGGLGGPAKLAVGLAKVVENGVNVGIDVADFFDNNLLDGTYIEDGAKYDVVKDFVSTDAQANMITGLTQFFAPFGALSKAFKVGQAATKIGAITKGSGVGALVDFMAFDPDEGRLTDLAQKHPELSWLIVDYLNSDTNDTRIESRFKNVLEGLILGGAATAGAGAVSKTMTVMGEGLTKILKMYKGARDVKAAMKTEQAAARLPIGESDEVMAKEAKAAGIADEAGEPILPGHKDAVVDKKGKLEIIVADDTPPNIIQPPRVKNDFVSIDPEELLKDSPDITKAFHVNLSKIEDTGDVHTAIKNLAKANEKNLAKVRSAAITEGDDLIALAKDMDVPPATLKRILESEGKKLDRAEILAMRGFFVAASDDVAKQGRLAIKTGSAAEKATYMEKLKLMANLYEVEVVAASEASGSLRAFNDLISPEERLRKGLEHQYMKTLGGDEVVEDIILRMEKIRVAAPKDYVRQMGKWVKKYKVAKVNEAVYETYIGNILAGATTHAKNILSNTFQAGVIAPLETGLLEAAGHVPRGSTRALVAGSAKSIKDAGITAVVKMVPEPVGNVMAQVIDYFGLYRNLQGESLQAARSSGNLLEIAGMKVNEFPPALTADNFGYSSQSAQGFVLDGLGKINRTSLAALQGADDFFKIIAYRGKINELAHASATKAGLRGEAHAAAMLEFKMNPPADIRMLAETFAKANTFTEDLTGSWLKVSNMTNFLGNTRLFGNVGPIKYFIPFSKTNLNLVRAGVERSPMYFATQEVNHILNTGTAAEKYLAHARMAYGTTFMAGMGILAHQGVTTGSGPEDFKHKAMWRDNYKHAYSFKLGDTSIKFADLGSLGTLAKISMDIGQIMEYTPVEDMTDAVALLPDVFVAAASQAFTPDFLTNGMSELLDIFSTDTPKEDKARFMSRMALHMTPIVGSRFLGTVRKEVDPFRRDAYTKEFFSPLQMLIDNAKNNIPGLSSTLPPARNFWGEPVMYGEGFVIDHTSPFFMSQNVDSPVMKEFARLGALGPGERIAEGIGEEEDVLTIGKPPRHLNLGPLLGKKKLSAEEYSRYIQLSAGEDWPPEFSQPNGNLHESLMELIKSPTYEELPDEHKIAIIKDIVSKTRQMAAQIMMLEVNTVTAEVDARMNALEEEAMGLDDVGPTPAEPTTTIRVR